MNLPNVSIIIPMYNNEKYVDLCLKSIFSLEYPDKKMELIVVDNGSTDSSVEIVKKYPLKVVSCPIGNISKVRNAGAAVAKGTVLAFVDSDCVVGPSWLSTTVNILERPRVVATGSGYRLPKDAKWVEKIWLRQSKIEEREVKFIPSGNFIVKADAFKEIGGFNESLVTCEDADICERLARKGFKLIYSTKIHSTHLRNPKTISEFFRKEMWYGINMTVSLKNQNLDKLFMLTVLFYLSHLLIILSFWWPYFLLIGILSLLTILNIGTIYKLYFSRKFKCYGHLMVLYYVFLMARGIGIFKSLLNRAN